MSNFRVAVQKWIFITLDFSCFHLIDLCSPEFMKNHNIFFKIIIIPTKIKGSLYT